MTSSDVAADIVDLLQRRSDVLAYLRDRPREKREFVDDLGVARSTVGRAIRELESADLVTYANGQYELTPVGERLVYEFSAFVERTELTVELEPVLRWAPQDAFDLDLRWLDDADLWTPEPNDPWAMVNRHVQALSEADHVRGMLPLVGLHAFEMVHDRVIEDGAEFSTVVESGVAETFRNDENYAPMYREVSSHDGFSVSVYEGEIPFFVGIFDDETVQIGVDEEKEPRALLETDRPEVRAWAHELVDEYEREASTQAADADSSRATSD